MSKERLDVLLVRKGYFESREKARRAIMSGIVLVENNKEDKPGTQVDEESSIIVKENPNPYASRGGFKLEKAVRTFNISLEGRTAIDVGASTGGFTDFMLQNGASKVFAIDVGYGQLAWKLRQDKRVVCMERTNIRYVKPEQLDTQPDFASVDVAFISLKLVIPVVRTLLHPEGEIVCLVKPQFEAGREKVGKRGVVRDASTHEEVLREIVDFVLNEGCRINGISYSPIKGPEGNIEYLLYLQNVDSVEQSEDWIRKVSEVVKEAHGHLNLN